MTDNLSMEILSTRLAGAGLCPCTPDPKTPSLLVGISGLAHWGCRMNKKNTLRGWSTAISCVALRKILSGCRHSVPIGLVCLWVSAKVQLFHDSTKYFSEKIHFKAFWARFRLSRWNLSTNVTKCVLRPFLGEICHIHQSFPGTGWIMDRAMTGQSQTSSSESPT